MKSAELEAVVLRRGAQGGLLRALSRGYTGILGSLNALAAVFVFILMLLISADVIGRFALNQPLQGTFEISQSLMVFIVFFGFAFTQYHKGNIRVQIVVQRLPPRGQALLDLLAHALGLAIFALVTYEAGRHAIASWQMGEASGGMVSIPLYPARLAVPVGCFFLAIQFATDAWSDLRRVVRGQRGG